MQAWSLWCGLDVSSPSNDQPDWCAVGWACVNTWTWPSSVDSVCWGPRWPSTLPLVWAAWAFPVFHLPGDIVCLHCFCIASVYCLGPGTCWPQPKLTVALRQEQNHHGRDDILKTFGRTLAVAFRVFKLPNGWLQNILYLVVTRLVWFYNSKVAFPP